MVFFSQETYEANMKLIHEGQHEIEPIKDINIKQLENIYRFEQSKDGNIILSYKRNKEIKKYIHSKYSPTKEAKRFIVGNRERIEEMISHSSKSKEFMIYGMACGYHIKEFIKQYPEIKVHIFEFNPDLFHYSLGFLELDELLNSPNVRIVVSKDKQTLLRQLGGYKYHTSFLVYKPSLEVIPEKLVEIKDFFIEVDLQRQTAEMNKNLLDENFMANTNHGFIECSPFLNLLKDAPMILVSAGPSLLKNIHYLKQAKKYALIGAVGTALKPLLSCGVQPDFIMVTDPKQYVLTQVNNSCNFPLFYLSTVCKEIVKSYKGPKFIIFQKGFNKAETLANNLSINTVKTGGSVATTLLDFMIQLGANPVCFVGQDLAYTNRQSHAEGTHLYRQIEENNTLHYVEDFYQNKKIPTSGNLKSYLKWFIRYIEENNHITFYNATEGGAYIGGATHISLEEFITMINTKLIDRERELFNHIVNESKNT